MFRILIADDHPMVREGLAKLLELEPDFEIVGDAGDGQGAINMVRKHIPDVVLMDISMPGTDGIAATRVIKKEFPGIKVIALTVCENEEVVDMIKAGASAYLLKDVSSHELIAAIRKVTEGSVFIHPRVAGRVVKELSNTHKHEISKLTRREIDVLGLLVKGFSNKEMAEIMYISEKTVKNHLTNIFRKLSLKDRTQAAIFALKNGLVKD